MPRGEVDPTPFTPCGPAGPVLRRDPESLPAHALLTFAPSTSPIVVDSRATADLPVIEVLWFDSYETGMEDPIAFRWSVAALTGDEVLPIADGEAHGATPEIPVASAPPGADLSVKVTALDGTTHDLVVAAVPPGR